MFDERQYIQDVNQKMTDAAEKMNAIAREVEAIYVAAAKDLVDYERGRGLSKDTVVREVAEVQQKFLEGLADRVQNRVMLDVLFDVSMGRA